jgi:hypothetical protein
VCCRSHFEGLFWLRGEYVPLCRIVADEVYRFGWLQAFGAHAVICTARRGDAVVLDRMYCSDMFNEAERIETVLTTVGWRRLQEALIAANFWSLPPFVHPRGVLDGYDLVVEGRRRNVFRATRLTNPDREELRRLGRVAFDIAGLDRVRL